MKHISKQEQKMATTESQDLGAKMDESISGERQAEMPRSGGKKGGWITFPFLIGLYLSF